MLQSPPLASTYSANSNVPLLHAMCTTDSENLLHADILYSVNFVSKQLSEKSCGKYFMVTLRTSFRIDVSLELFSSHCSLWREPNRYHNLEFVWLMAGWKARVEDS
jgi:hypothetical protein